jgi:hypothetical protein
MVDSTAVAMDTTMVAETPNIVGVAAANEDFSTLVTAVKAANLVETLSGDGPLLFLHRITLHLQNSSGNGRNLKARKFRQTEISFNVSRCFWKV